jgi:hypothetical protein
MTEATSTQTLLLDNEVALELSNATATSEALQQSTSDVADTMPTLEDEAQVDRYLRALRFYTDDLNAANALADAEVARIEEWRTKQTSNAQGAVGYLTARLQQFSEFVGRTKRTSPNGVLKWAKARERVVIDDVDYFCTQWSDSGFVRVKIEPDKAAVMAHVKAHGTEPEGASIERGDDTFKIDLPR